MSIDADEAWRRKAPIRNAAAWLLAHTLPRRFHLYILKWILPAAQVREAYTEVIEAYEAQGVDILADAAERMLEDPQQRAAAMKFLLELLLVPRRSISPWSVRQAIERTCCARPDLLREVLRQGLVGTEAWQWRLIGKRLGVGVDEQGQLLQEKLRERLGDVLDRPGPTGPAV